MMMMTRRSYSDPRDAHPTCQILPKLIDLSWVKIFKKLIFFFNQRERSEPSFQALHYCMRSLSSHQNLRNETLWTILVDREINF